MKNKTNGKLQIDIVGIRIIVERKGGYMKKSSFAVLALAAVALAACQTGGTSSSEGGASTSGTSLESIPGSGGGQTSSETADPLEAALVKARNGFNAITETRQNVYNAATDEFIFSNEARYEYGFQNQGRIKTYQIYDYYDTHTEMKVVRDASGYAATEFINYKNEVDTAELTDSEGYPYNYDHYYSNPFLYIEREDLTSIGNSVYEVNEEKRDYLSFLLFANTSPLVAMTLTLGDGVFTGAAFKTSDVDSFTKELPGGGEADEYYKCYFNYEAQTTFLEMGTFAIPDPLPSPASEEASDLIEAFAALGTNYTLTQSVRMDGASPEPDNDAILYVDGSRAYLDYSRGDTTLDQDSLFAPDAWEDDGLLYENIYDGSSWAVAPADSANAYNIDPQGLSFFTPHASEISANLISSAGNGKYYINNEEALPYIGNAFLPDVLSFPLYDYGATTEVDIELGEETIAISIDFLYPTSYGVYAMVYDYVYSNIGTTLLPIGE